MFTGLVEELGKIESFTRQGGAARVTVVAPQVTGRVCIGDSVAVDGVCLTVTTVEGDQFTADVMPQTLTLSTLGGLSAGCVVNVERAITPTRQLGGHLVQGHVDAVGLLLARRPGDQCEVLRISLPPQLAMYVVPQGPIAVDGVSLTVVGVGGRWFDVSLIPTTLRDTGLGAKPTGAAVNLEADVLSKYMYRHLQHYLSHHPLLPYGVSERAR
ncbi:riboflavin synthase [Streptomyces collinus]|uniref:riboflavin synthase n=1 Tax=Streptomyces collinus TaxID=42684 RepID=UPI0036B9D747